MYIITIFITIFLFLSIFVVFATGAYAGFSAAPWAPTERKSVERFVKLADIKRGEKMYDLGCGDGRMIFAAAKKGADVEGLEIAILPFIFTTIFRLFQKEKEKIKISYCDIWRKNLSDADIVYFFLMPKVCPKIGEKLKKELKHGAKVITCCFPIENWTPEKVDKKEGRQSFFLYKM